MELTLGQQADGIVGAALLSGETCTKWVDGYRVDVGVWSDGKHVTVSVNQNMESFKCQRKFAVNTIVRVISRLKQEA